MNINDIHLKFLINSPIKIDGIGNFHLPTLRQVIDMGEEAYNQYLSSLLFNKDYLNSDSDDINSLTDYQLLVNFLYHDKTFNDAFFSAIEMLFNTRPVINNQGLIYFGELSDESVFTNGKWELVKKLVRIGNFLKEEEKEEYSAGNERAKKFIEELKKKRAKMAGVKKQEKINLHSIISAVAWRTTGIDKVGDLTIYQLYDAFHRLGTIDNYHYTYTGIYTGNIDTKGINLSDINWANVIKIN